MPDDRRVVVLVVLVVALGVLLRVAVLVPVPAAVDAVRHVLGFRIRKIAGGTIHLPRSRVVRDAVVVHIDHGHTDQIRDALVERARILRLAAREAAGRADHRVRELMPDDLPPRVGQLRTHRDVRVLARGGPGERVVFGQARDRVDRAARAVVALPAQHLVVVVVGGRDRIHGGDRAAVVPHGVILARDEMVKVPVARADDALRAPVVMGDVPRARRTLLGHIRQGASVGRPHIAPLVLIGIRNEAQGRTPLPYELDMRDDRNAVVTLRVIDRDAALLVDERVPVAVRRGVEAHRLAIERLAGRRVAHRLARDDVSRLGGDEVAVGAIARDGDDLPCDGRVGVVERVDGEAFGERPPHVVDARLDRFERLLARHRRLRLDVAHGGVVAREVERGARAVGAHHDAAAVDGNAVVLLGEAVVAVAEHLVCSAFPQLGGGVVHAESGRGVCHRGAGVVLARDRAIGERAAEQQEIRVVPRAVSTGRHAARAGRALLRALRREPEASGQPRDEVAVPRCEERAHRPAYDQDERRERDEQLMAQAHAAHGGSALRAHARVLVELGLAIPAAFHEASFRRVGRQGSGSARSGRRRCERGGST